MTVIKVSADSTALTIAVTAYSSGDVVGGLWTLPLGLPNGSRYKIVGGNLLDDGDVLAACDLFIFRASVTPAADNAAVAMTDADQANCVGVLQWATADVYDMGPNKHLIATGKSIHCDTADGSLYAVLVTRSGNAVFTANDDLHLVLFIDTTSTN